MREPYARTVDPHVVISGSRDLPGEIYRNLRAAIIDGHVVGGERLPATRELAVRLNVSRTTVATAYDRLSARGMPLGEWVRGPTSRPTLLLGMVGRPNRAALYVRGAHGSPFLSQPFFGSNIPSSAFARVSPTPDCFRTTNGVG